MAAAEVQKGTGIIHGIANNGSPLKMSGYATFILETAKGGHKFKLDAIEDELGFDKALTAVNGHVELDITWAPSGQTRAVAHSSAVFLPPLSKVTLENFKLSAFNGDWVYVGDEAIDLSHAAAKMSIKLRKYDDATQNASLVQTITG